MAIDGELRGVTHSGEKPEWVPLVQAVGTDVASWFMYMFRVGTSDGRRLHAYKHIATRCYVHLDDDGNAFYYAEPDRYRPIALADILEAVLAPWWELGLADGEARDVAAAKRVIAKVRRSSAPAATQCAAETLRASRISPRC
jgi:hypothetical protein